MTYTIREAAKALDVSERTLRRAVEDGELPAAQEPRGKRIVTVIQAGDLAAYAQATRRTLAGIEGTRLASLTGIAGAETGEAPANGAAQAAELASLRRENAALAAERDYLRRMLEQALKALPAPQDRPAEQAEPRGDRRSWWRRVWGRKA